MDAMQELIGGRNLNECLPKQTEIMPNSLLESLKRDLLRKENQAEDIKKAILFLEKNPQFEEFSKLITKIR